MILGILIGLIVGLVLFGGAGFAIARVTDRPIDAGPAPSASASASLYERSQLALSRTKVTGNLIAFSETWLPYVSGCSRDGDPNGPKLNSGEVSRVACERGAVRVTFVEYRSISDRDKMRTRVLGQNVDARALAPGVANPTEGREEPRGYYIEYAYKTSSETSNRVYVGIWWDSINDPVAGYILTSWEEGLDSHWEPLRDLWKNPR
ncbi:MAG: hypothetical protein HKP61_11105 [Dactylosporangium sp.]|nr:hypothetical protein [Dactylosporangium sp.]NNJ61474.1 hypothetical protein [Dactylosporangium sp.]